LFILTHSYAGLGSGFRDWADTPTSGFY